MLVTKELHEVEGWTWAEDMVKVEWEMSTKEWIYRIKTKSHFTDYLNQKWGCSNSTKQWKNQWERIWKSAIHHRRKSWIWRFLQRGYFTGSREKAWNEELQQCLKCRSEVETLEHAFWECPRLQRRIREMKAIGIIPENAMSILDWLDSALDRSKEDTSQTWAFGNPPTGSSDCGDRMAVSSSWIRPKLERSSNHEVAVPGASPKRGNKDEPKRQTASD
ncbi:hypothetical protein R1sor_024768 [Riccia sorocarpa]|uniref:Reverse transcriptase zinc-binding domain-containing protein n=1 Tax=Riccia sorocarpa TaxID=122646 RepID=A0ABD3GRE8_9MARC